MVSKKERSELGRALAALRRKVEVKCAVCGKVVKGSKVRRYCSDACRQEAYRKRHKT
jgi:MYND finger